MSRRPGNLYADEGSHWDITCFLPTPLFQAPCPTSRQSAPWRVAPEGGGPRSASDPVRRKRQDPRRSPSPGPRYAQVSAAATALDFRSERHHLVVGVTRLRRIVDEAVDQRRILPCNVWRCHRSGWRRRRSATGGSQPKVGGSPRSLIATGAQGQVIVDGRSVVPLGHCC